MRIISFAETTPALLAGRKTVTRREWADSWASKFHAGDLVAAYDRSPRARGKHVATIRLTRDPYQEAAELAPSEDFEAEGFGWMTEQGRTLWGHSPLWQWRLWKHQNPVLWVVRFELVERVRLPDALEEIAAGRRRGDGLS